MKMVLNAPLSEFFFRKSFIDRNSLFLLKKDNIYTLLIKACGYCRAGFRAEGKNHFYGGDLNVWNQENF
jgi:hypothetical protein